VRQTIVTDTSWRTDPPRFPARWLITATVGALRYPDLPGRIAAGFGGSGHKVPKSVISVFSVMAAQLYVSVLWTGLILIIYRSRPDIDAADPTASALRYRRFLTACSRALLTLIALVDLSLLLVALRDWQLIRLSGAGAVVPVLPFAAGVLLLAAVTLRAGQGGSRLNGNVRGLAPTAGADRDDDRFWKGGLLYVNRDDPSIMVGSRTGGASRLCCCGREL
jgi:uncharacterized membrane protein